MNTSIKIAAILSVFTLAGCNEEKIANPDIYNVGTYEGCDVKYIDRGAQSRSFYVAKCTVPSTTVTNSVPSGKTSYQTATVTIQPSDVQQVDPKQQQIQLIEQQLQQLQSQLNDLKKP